MSEDVVELLLSQHMRIRDMFIEVQNATGEARREAFENLLRFLAVHEAAEKQVVHPLAGKALDGGDAIVADRVEEEKQAGELQAQLVRLGPDHPDFPTLLRQFRAAVLHHAHREEHYEFRYLRQRCTPEQLLDMADAVRAVMANA